MRFALKSATYLVIIYIIAARAILIFIYQFWRIYQTRRRNGLRKYATTVVGSVGMDCSRACRRNKSPENRCRLHYARCAAVMSKRNILMASDSPSKTVCNEIPPKIVPPRINTVIAVDTNVPHAKVRLKTTPLQCVRSFNRTVYTTTGYISDAILRGTSLIRTRT